MKEVIRDLEQLKAESKLTNSSRNIWNKLGENIKYIVSNSVEIFDENR